MGKPAEGSVKSGLRAFTALMDRRRSLAQILPVYVLVIALLLVGQALHSGFVSLANLGAIFVLSTFVAVVAFAQGIAVLTGGLDLSVAWVMTAGGIMLTALSQGSNVRALWAVPLVLATGTFIGLLNGLGIVLLDIAPIVMTLAMNVIVEGAVMTTISGTPSGAAPPFLTAMATRNMLPGVPWLALFFIAFTLAGILVLNKTRFGREVYAVGNSPLVARLSGVNVNRVLVTVYAISGFCAALAGMLAAGYTRTAFLGTGDNYLLPSLAAIIVGGASIFGGRGQYASTAGGAILLTVLSAILASLNWPDAVRTIVYGLVILVTVVLLHEGDSG